MLSGLLVGAVAWTSSPVLAQEAEAPRLFHMPLRWCVLEGTRAARDADAAVLTRLRRASSILAPQSGITLRSPVTSALRDGPGFPVIRDPRTAVGKPGDVRVPTESSAEYSLVVARCAQAWQRLVRQSETAEGEKGIAKGPIGVIIGDFVDARGRPLNSVWGYAFSASTNSDWCDAQSPSVRWATGGSLMVVDSSDRSPSPLLDRRLVAHEMGHILRLGHGDGLDNPGSIQGRIDKWCDDTENDYATPGSLMTVTLSYERVTPWQQRLPRSVAAVHPVSVQDLASIGFVTEQEQWRQMERIANGGHRLARRSGPRPEAPLTRLPPLWDFDLRGDEAYDDVRDPARGGMPVLTPSPAPSASPVPVGPETPETGLAPGESPAPTPMVGSPSARGPKSGSVDLVSAGISVDDDSGTIAISVKTRGAPGGAGPSDYVVMVDADGDPTTGGDPGALDWPQGRAAGEAPGVDLVIWITAGSGEPTSRAWTWDRDREAWVELVPPPLTQIAGIVGEDDHADPGDDTGYTEDTVIVIIDDASIGIVDEPRMRVELTTHFEGQRDRVDALPGEPGSGGMVALHLATPEYPVCAVNRNRSDPNRTEPGAVATLEVHGFGVDGPVTVWLADRELPIARGYYEEVPGCAWPWITQVTIPADTIETMQMVQVSMDGTGMTADCPVLIGSATVPFYGSSDEPG